MGNRLRRLKGTAKVAQPSGRAAPKAWDYRTDNNSTVAMQGRGGSGRAAVAGSVGFAGDTATRQARGGRPLTIKCEVAAQIVFGDAGVEAAHEQRRIGGVVGAGSARRALGQAER